MIKRKDPVGTQRFDVEINGLTVGGFSEISGLDMEIETEQIYEGGLNYHVHNLFKRMKYGRLSFKKGVMPSSDMLDWYNECQTGAIKKKDMSVFLQNLSGESIREWRFVKAYPVKCFGPRLVASGSNEIAVETIEFVYEAQYNKKIK